MVDSHFDILRRAGATLGAIAMLAVSAPSFGDEQPGEDYLSGDWGGARSKLSDAGVSLTLNYIGEFMSVTSGGLDQKGYYLSRTDLGVTLDTDKLMGWKGGTFQLTVMRTDGEQPNNAANTFQGVSNIEAPVTLKILEAWLEQEFSESASLRLGLYDLNSEFDVIESAKLFSNPSFGIGADYSQSGINGPSIFPTTSLALRARYQTEGNIYLQAAVLDGVPGKPGAPHSTYVSLDKQDGWLVSAEAGYQTARDEKSKDRYLKLGVGAWYYTEPLTTDVNGTAITAKNNQGFYLLGEAQLYRASNEGLKGLHGFLRYGHADAELNQASCYLGVGLNYIGLIPGRDEDQLGLALAQIKNGDTFLSANPALAQHETIWELAYRARITPWLSVQPDVQYIVHPNTDPAVPNATVVSLRMFLAF